VTTISHEEALEALNKLEADWMTKAALTVYIQQQRDAAPMQAPAPRTEALFTEAQVMELVTEVRDAALGALPPDPGKLSTLELFRWLREHAGGSMTNAARNLRRFKSDARTSMLDGGMRYRAEAFAEGMRWRYALRLDRAAKAISAWRERHMGAVKPEAPAELTAEQAILLAEITRDEHRPWFETVAEEAQAEGADEETNAA
jgi:hypothetical protein